MKANVRRYASAIAVIKMSEQLASCFYKTTLLLKRACAVIADSISYLVVIVTPRRVVTLDSGHWC